MLPTFLFLALSFQFAYAEVTLTNGIVSDVIKSNFSTSAAHIAGKFASKFGSNESFLVLLYDESCQPFEFAISSNANYGTATVNSSTVVVVSHPKREGQFIPTPLMTKHLETKYRNLISAINSAMLDTLVGNIKLSFALTVRGHFTSCGYAIATSSDSLDYGATALYGHRLFVYSFQ